MAILTTIIAWETFQMLATILIFIFLNKILKKWTKGESEKKKQIKKGFTIIVIFLGLIIIFSGFYIVHTNENVVLTKITGTKLIVKDIGIGYSLLGSANNFYLGKEELNYPTFRQTGDLSNLFGEEELSTKDKKIVRYSVVLYYQITDLNKFAIKSKDSETKLFYNLGAELTNEITTNTYETIMQDRRQIENRIMESLKGFEETYGVEVLDLKFLRITDSTITISAKAEAEAEKIKSEAMINLAKSEAIAMKEKYNSIEDKDFMRYMELINAIKEGEVNTIVVPENSGVIVNANQKQ